jgi:hypothetical protein
MATMPENFARGSIDRISESSKASLYKKNGSIVSISLKSDDFSPFGASACTKNEEEPPNLRCRFSCGSTKGAAKTCRIRSKLN